MEERNEQLVVLDEETLELIGVLSKGVLSMAGLESMAPAVSAAYKLVNKLTFSGYEIPGVEEFSDKLNAFAAKGHVPTE